jgi:hypothetical protein
MSFWQAQSARHPAVRTVYARIAEDELSHAALAWRVAEWIEERLTPPARERVQAARAQAIAALSHEVTVDVAPELSAVAGVPEAPTAVALVAHLRESLWAA